MSNKKDEVQADDIPGRPPTQRSFLQRLVDAMQTMDESPYDHLEHRIHALEAQMERLTRSIKNEKTTD